jgi:hypothetical protein
MFQKILFYIQIIITGAYKFVRDYVIPVITFVSFIKELLEKEIDAKEGAKIRYDKTKFIDSLNYTSEIIDYLISAFVYSIRILLPELAPSGQAYYVIIDNFIEHLRKLEPAQRTMLLFKIASYMLINYSNKRNKIKLKEHEADLYVQMVYSFKKNKRLG